MNFNQLKYFSTYILFAILLSGTVYYLSYRSAINQLAQTGSVRVEQASDRLLEQLASFRQLPNFLARHPKIISALDGTAAFHETNAFLLDTALMSGANNIVILDKSGATIAASNYSEEFNVIGKTNKSKPHVQAALNGRLGFYHAIEASDNTRGFYYAREIFIPNTPDAGVVVIQLDVATLEFEWRVDEEVLAFFDNNGVVFITNRQSLSLRHETDDNNNTINAPQYAELGLKPFFKNSKTQVFGYNIWNFVGNTVLPKQALVLSRFVPQIDMTARVFISTAQAKTTANLQTLLIASLLAIIGLGMWVLHQRRQRLTELLAIEEAANIMLEARVEERTKQLHNTQHQLIQAGKLTAMGQMSAGISHELNQPLAAIHNFADSGNKLIERGRTDDAQENFKLINQQIDRISRIIRSLRAFARKEKETIEPVDLCNVILESINLTKARCEQENVHITLKGASNPIFVMGGHVRLQQVVINLITNAIDALSQQTDKQIHIDLTKQTTHVQFIIHDNGSGLDEDARIFEPFYSTKAIGASKGLGLGLSISYGIIGSFGGDIRCQNHPSGGAEFTVILKHATEKITDEKTSSAY